MSKRKLYLIERRAAFVGQLRKRTTNETPSDWHEKFRALNYPVLNVWNFRQIAGRQRNLQAVTLNTSQRAKADTRRLRMDLRNVRAR